MEQLLSCPNLNSPGSVVSGLFTYFLASIMTKQCEFSNVVYPPDRGNDVLDNKTNIDFIVVGSGSSGSVVANRLSEINQWNILLIEAGIDPSVSSNIPGVAFSLQKTPMDWTYVSEKQQGVCEGLQGGVCNIPRGKALGGTSNLNAMMYVIGNPKDYDSWGNEDWNFKNVEKYFHKSFQDYYSVGFVNRTDYFNTYRMIDTIKRATQELDLDILNYKNRNINPNKVGTLNIKTTIRDGERLNTAKAFLAPIKNRPNLFVLKNTEVTKILFENKRAIGVQILRDNKQHEIKFNKELILSAGAVNSPKLLFQSGIGDEEELKKENVDVKLNLPSVGKYLIDHPMFVVPVQVSFPPRQNRTEKSTSSQIVNELDELFNFLAERKRREKSNMANEVPNLDELYNYIDKKIGTLAGLSISDYFTFIDTTEKNPDNPDAMLINIYFPKGDNKLGLTTMLEAYNWNKSTIDNLMKNPNDIYFLMIMLLRPLSQGNITIAKNVHEKPKIFLNYLEKKQDSDILLKTVRFIERFIKTKAFKKYNSEIVKVPDDKCDKLYKYNSDEYWECTFKRRTHSYYHLSSTCRMGDTADSSVVNYKLKVHNIDNVRIADASVMQKTVSGNIHATCMMIGEKCADIIKQDWNEHV